MRGLDMELEVIFLSAILNENQLIIVSAFIVLLDQCLDPLHHKKPTLFLSDVFWLASTKLPLDSIRVAVSQGRFRMRLRLYVCWAASSDHASWLLHLDLRRTVTLTIHTVAIRTQFLSLHWSNVTPMKFRSPHLRLHCFPTPINRLAAVLSHIDNLSRVYFLGVSSPFCRMWWDV